MADRTDAARSVTPLDPYRIQVSYGAGNRAAGIVQGGGADWFGPLDPPLPVAPADVRGRAWDFPAGYNLDIRPRAYEPVTYGDLRGLAESYDLLRLVIETRKDQMARLSWSIVPRTRARGAGAAAPPPADPALLARAAGIERFLRRPDGVHRWADWLRLLLEDLFVIDAPALFVCRSRGGAFLSAAPRAGGAFGLHPLDGATLKRVIDDFGRTPAWPAPAFQHILHGVPAVEYTTRDILFRPRNARVHRAYGMSPVEQILMTVNIALRRQLFTLNYFTEGNIPESLIGVPEHWTPDQVAAFQRNWDAMLEGNLAARRHARFVPADVGKTFVQTKDPELKGVFDEWLARLTCYAFSVSPEPFLSKVNRATAESAHDAALEEGLAPLQDFVKGWIDDILERDDLLAAPELEFKWHDDREVDPVKQEAVLTGYVKAGIYTINEARDRLGLQPLPDAAAGTAMVETGQGYVPIGANASGRGDGAKEADVEGVESGQHTAQGIRKYNADQPRVPKGSPEGGRWTHGDGNVSEPASRNGSSHPATWDVPIDLTPGLLVHLAASKDPNHPSNIPNSGWDKSKDANRGHHYVVQELFKKEPLQPETRAVFRDWITGELPKGLNVNNEEHRIYNSAVKELFKSFLDKRNITAAQMTPDQAMEFAAEVLFSDDPRIRDFRVKIDKGREAIKQGRNPIEEGRGDQKQSAPGAEDETPRGNLRPLPRGMIRGRGGDEE